MKRRIAANYVYPVVGEPIRNGFLEFDENGTLLNIGTLTEETESTEFYNGVLVPGFTNAHCHLELSHLVNKFEQGTGMSGFINQINALRESAGPEERIERAQTALDKMYAEGISAMADISNCNETFAMKAASPMYTRTFLEVFGTLKEEALTVLDEVGKLHKEAQKAGIDAAPTPHSPYTMSPELLTLSSAAAVASGFLSYHNQESDEEEDLILTGTGALAENYKGRGLPTPPVLGKPAVFHFLNCLRKTGKRYPNANILLVHNVATNEESIDAVQQELKHVTWVTCPLSNLFIHRCLAPLDLFRKKGLNIAIGTDSLSSNTILSMIEEIKCIQEHFPHIPFAEILTWATLNGAKALSKEDTYGSFEVGKKPGAVLIENFDFENGKPSQASTTRRIL